MLQRTAFKRTLLAVVHELTSVHALSSDEDLLVLLVAVRVAELHTGHGGTPARVMHDLPDHTLDVAVAFGVIQGAQLGSALAGRVV